MKKNSGFTLIEVLVTLLLTAIGILGMVAMQSRAIHQTQDAVQRNTAVMLVNELVDIMRANSSEIFALTPPHVPLYMNAKDSSIFYKAKGTAFSTGTCSNPTNAKTAQEQLNCWVAKVSSSLPVDANTLKDHVYICFSSSKGECDGGSTIEIQLAWKVKEDTCPVDADADIKAPNKETCFYNTRVEL